MPPVRNKRRDFEEVEELVASGAEGEDDEEDDMPPLVDQPAESSLVPSTYTFLTDMTHSNPHPIPNMQTDSGPEQAVSSNDQDTTSYILPPRTTNHGKRRDSSYIPRPPNAFILFRSSFIRSQRVTGKVEGNHSNLSKIIGRIWKGLSDSERSEWEEKAQLAQAEHRKRYPDWRFRPGANALAKLKIPDPGGPLKAKRIRGTKDPPDDVAGSPVEFKFEDSALSTKSKGKGKEKANASRSQLKARGRTDRRIDDVPDEQGRSRDTNRKESEEKRIAKIADFLVEGKEGVELEVALQEWERGRKEGLEENGNRSDRGSPTNVHVSMAPPHGPSSAPSSGPSSALSSPVTPLYNTAQQPVNVAWTGSAPTSPFVPSPPHSGSQASSAGSSRVIASTSGYRSPSPRSPRRQQFHASPPGPSPLQVQVDVHSHVRPANPNRSPASPHLGPPPSATVQENFIGFPLSTIPLTHAHKRSSSAPAIDQRPLMTHAHASPGTFSAPSASTERPGTTRAHQEDALASQNASDTPVYTELSRPSPTHRRDTVSLPLHHWGPSSSFNNDTDFSSRQSRNTGTSAPIRLPWQEEEDRRRHEVAYGHPIWISNKESEADEGEEFEPIREGAFNVLIGGDAGVSGFPRPEGTEEFAIHLPQPPPPVESEQNTEWTSQPGAFGMSHVNLEVNYDDYANSGLECASYPVDTGSFAYIPPATYSPTDSTTPQKHSPVGADDSSTHQFYPQAPIRLSSHPPISTFSSLAGWAGEPAKETMSPSHDDRDPNPSPWQSVDRSSGFVQPTGIHSQVRWQTNEGDRYFDGNLPGYGGGPSYR